MSQITEAVISLSTTDSGELYISAYANMLDPKTKIVKLLIFNVLGTINPVEEVYAMARTIGAVSLVDGA